jgi:hypothetical protein
MILAWSLALPVSWSGLLPVWLCWMGGRFVDGLLPVAKAGGPLLRPVCQRLALPD